MSHNLQEILAFFLECGINDFPKETYCVFAMKEEEGDNKVREILQNTRKSLGDVHAEIKAISRMKELLEFNKGETVTLFLNYSPCAACANKLIEFVSTNQFRSSIAELKIVFCHIYRSNEPPNQEGLRNMHEAKIKLQAFTPDLWQEFICLLHDVPTRKRKDEEVKESLEYILQEVELVDSFASLNVSSTPDS